MSYIRMPIRIGLWMRLFLWITKKIAGRDMALPRLLAWSPKLALASGILEAASTRPEGSLTPRLLKLVRIEVSLRASCSFCLDMNSVDFAEVEIRPGEITALQNGQPPGKISTLSDAERAALVLAQALTATPIAVNHTLAREAQKYFSEREFLLLTATCAQVNYWARLAQGLGIAPEGFTTNCAWLKPYAP